MYLNFSNAKNVFHAMVFHFAIENVPFEYKIVILLGTEQLIIVFETGILFLVPRFRFRMMNYSLFSCFMYIFSLHIYLKIQTFKSAFKLFFNNF